MVFIPKVVIAVSIIGDNFSVVAGSALGSQFLDSLPVSTLLKS
jgi:hypothetical protein